MVEWFVCCTTKLATWVPSRVGAGLPTGNSVLCGGFVESPEHTHGGV